MHDLGLVGCVGVWGAGFGGWGVVLGLCGLVSGLCGGGAGFGCDGFWDMVLGGWGGTGWVRRLMCWTFGTGGLCWGMGDYA